MPPTRKIVPPATWVMMYPVVEKLTKRHAATAAPRAKRVYPPVTAVRDRVEGKGRARSLSDQRLIRAPRVERAAPRATVPREIQKMRWRSSGVVER